MAIFVEPKGANTGEAAKHGRDARITLLDVTETNPQTRKVNLPVPVAERP